MSSVPASFIHALAVQISKQLNRTSVNENLAKQVINFVSSQPNKASFTRACKAFGNFDDSFLESIYDEISEKLKSLKLEKDESGSRFDPPIVQNNSDNYVFQKDIKLESKNDFKPYSDLPPIQSGLVFVKPKREISPSDTGDSKYGLDKLAKKIKRENTSIKNEPSFHNQDMKIKTEDVENNFDGNNIKEEAIKPHFRKIVHTSNHTRNKHEEETDRPTSSNRLSSQAREKLEEIRRRRTEEPRENNYNYNHRHRNDSHKNNTNGENIENYRDRSSLERKNRHRDDNRRSTRSYNDSRSSNSNDRLNLPGDDEYDQESLMALDRDWYTGDEFGHAAGDEAHNPFGDGLNYASEEKELEKRVNTRISTLRKQKQRDSDIWEQNRMKTSGIGGGNDFQSDFMDDDDDDNKRIHVMVHDLRPPFLDGKQVFTRNKEPISAIKDSQSDMAVFARQGSALVRQHREKRERQKQARDSASVAGTILGNVLGVTEDEDKSQNEESSGTIGSEKFSDHLNKRSEGASDFSKKLTLKQQRQFLPAFAVRDELLKVIRDNQVIIVIGETGSGKTTQLTQFLYEDGYGKRGTIGCTQPRRVAAISVAKRVSEEMEVKLGSTVGYAIRFEDCTSSETIIKYMTDGVLLRESLTDPELDSYSCIIMDEAHERALNTDVLMGLFKNILLRRRDLKLIITSATMNAERFSQFYGGAPQFTIPGRTFPVDVQNHSTPVEDYVDAAVKQVLSIHIKNGPGDILVFMTGQEDIEVTCEVIAEKLKILDNPQKLEILPIYSQLPADLQAKIFNPASKGTRKVIVATNIAETSLTVDGIKYVVDCGYSKIKVYNPKIGMDSLQLAPVSLANANQRSGRAGRTGNGIAYRLYTERAQVDEMYAQAIPEIQRTNLSNTLLLLKSLGVNDLLDFNFMDPPPADTMTSSLFDLWALGALDNLGHLTTLGEKMSKFPMEPSLAKLLIKSLEYGCTEEMLTVVSMLSVPSVFYRPKERQEEADAAREKFFVAESDHLTLLHVYKQWISNNSSDVWCARHFLHPRALRRAREVREQLVFILRNHKHEIRSCGTDWDVARKCICCGYYSQAARVRGLGQYMGLRSNVIMQLHPTSALYGQGYLPEYVVYHELVLTSKEYMSVVTAVSPYWLTELGGVFYSIKERGFSAKTGAKIDVSHNEEHNRIEEQLEKDREAYAKEKEEEKNGSKKNKKKKESKKGAVILPQGKKSFGGRRGF